MEPGLTPPELTPLPTLPQPPQHTVMMRVVDEEGREVAHFAVETSLLSAMGAFSKAVFDLTTPQITLVAWPSEERRRWWKP